MENCPQIQSKTVNLLPTIRLAQSILTCKFPSVHKPLQKKAPQKGHLKNISPRAYFRNFMVAILLKKLIPEDSHSSLASLMLACVIGVKRGRGNFARVHKEGEREWDQVGFWESAHPPLP